MCNFNQGLEVVVRAKDADQHYGVALSVIRLTDADPMVAEALIRSPKVGALSPIIIWDQKSI